MSSPLLIGSLSAQIAVNFWNKQKSVLMKWLSYSPRQEIPKVIWVILSYQNTSKFSKIAYCLSSFGGGVLGLELVTLHLPSWHLGL